MKLIIINGPSGVGKSTLAKELNSQMEMSYLLDVDQIRHNMSGFKENRDRSRELSFELSLKTTDACLENNLDVIVDKMMYEDSSGDYDYLERFIELGRKHNAEIIELILHADKESVLGRLEERGYPTEGINTPEIAEKHWDNFENYRSSRKEAVLIDVSGLSPEETLKEVLDKISL